MSEREKKWLQQNKAEKNKINEKNHRIPVHIIYFILQYLSIWIMI